MVKRKTMLCFVLITILSLPLFIGCESVPKDDEEGAKPEIPEPISDGEGEEPTLAVYFHEEEEIEEMEFEEYIKGVVAGEMEPDWPEDALAAQAIIARSFTLHKIDNEGGLEDRDAHASTDIEEFQAYSEEDITEQVENAVDDTRGVVATHDNEYIQAWFHAFAGPRTALATEGLDFEDENPPYIQIVESQGDEIIPEEEGEWELELQNEEIIEAASEAGAEVQEDNLEMEIAEEGPSGRATVLEIGEQEVSAPDFRLAVGSEEMRSTYIEELENNDDGVRLEGEGFGHGVGMCQWGAKKLAQDGDEPEDIMRYFYEDIEISKIWD
ncbi:SpoIID/LytB domain-containing protein [Natranaerofaba carboxydovora]|uniref:SpoIID/LytB domain-containing protein n=1 Tax=Natranaerofaba carboxydovora TaxID=2742683 RepID=UPI001F13111C|nr:SpoIID/LytB domain-containing protein [Natranaerofaba carboxydovora]UMZ75279.1 Amidase enhancer [Natranaerofaba carboxydovora]